MTSADVNQRAAELTTLLEQSRAAKKPDLAEMRAWVAAHDDPLLTSCNAYAEVYGRHHPDQVRIIVVIRQLVDFLDRCGEHQEAITTVFRAAAHRQQWRRR